MSRLGTYRIKGVEYDLDDLTLDEMEQIEELCDGTPFTELHYGRTKTMKAIAFTLMKRGSPDLRYEDVGSVKLVEFVAADEDMPPLPPEVGVDEKVSDTARDDSGPLR